MADATLTAANVRPLNGAIVRRFTAGGNITLGQPVYLSADGVVSCADGSAVSTSFAIGVAVATPDGGTSVVSGEEVDVVVFGPIAGYSAMTGGTLYYVSDTAGTLSDSTGDATKDTIVGYAEEATILFVRPVIVDFS